MDHLFEEEVDAWNKIEKPSRINIETKMAARLKKLKDENERLRGVVVSYLTKHQLDHGDNFGMTACGCHICKRARALLGED